MNKIKKISVFVVVFCFTLSCFSLTNIYAASFSIGASSGSVEPNGSFTVSVNLDGAGLFSFSASNGSVSTGSQFCDGSCSFSVVAGSSGSTTVTVAAGDVTGYDESPITGSQSVSVTINTPSGGGSSGGGSSSGGSASGGNTSGGGSTVPTTPTETKSSDSSLSSLVVSKGTLDPIFESGTTEYKISLAADVTALTIEATTNDSKASVSGTGERTVAPGDNALDVVVTAEDGSTKTYVINAYVDEKPDTFIKKDGKDFGVVPNVDDVSSPTGFEKTTVMFGDKEIPAWKNTITNLTLVYVIDEKNEKNFHIFENNELTSVYKPIALLGYNLAIIDIPSELQERKGFVFTEIEIDGQKLQGWLFENEQFSNYSLLYAMNEKGEKVFFQYEKVSNTLQPYSGAAAITQEAYEQQATTNFMLWIAVSIAGVSSIIFLTMWILASRKNRRYKGHREDYEEMPTEQYEEEVIMSETSPIDIVEEEQRPPHHQQAHPRNEDVVNQEKTYETQPFRFHDDFDDNELK